MLNSTQLSLFPTTWGELKGQLGAIKLPPYTGSQGRVGPPGHKAATLTIAPRFPNIYIIYNYYWISSKYSNIIYIIYN